MKTAFFPVVITLAGIAASGVSAQPVSASQTGKITHAEGNVYLDGWRVKEAEHPIIAENSLVRTEDGRAEVLPAPGVTPRLGENRSFRIMANRAGDTRIALLAGAT